MIERNVRPCPLPSPHEREILIHLIEEAAEVQQRATKLLRFGRDEIQPGQPHSNAERLSIELGDMGALIDLALEAGLIDGMVMNNQMFNKFRNLKTFYQT